MATTFQWSDERQCMVPIQSFTIQNQENETMGNEANETVTTTKAELETLLKGKKRGKTASFDPGPNPVTVSTRISNDWLTKVCDTVGTKNKSHALFIAVQKYLETLK